PELVIESVSDHDPFDGTLAHSTRCKCPGQRGIQRAVRVHSGVQDEDILDAPQNLNGTAGYGTPRRNASSQVVITLEEHLVWCDVYECAQRCTVATQDLHEVLRKTRTLKE